MLPRNKVLGYIQISNTDIWGLMVGKWAPRRHIAVGVIGAIVLTAGVLAVPTAAAAHGELATNVVVFFQPSPVRTGQRFVTLTVWNKGPAPTCGPITVTINRVYPASIDAVGAPAGWGVSQGNEARITSPAALQADQSAIIKLQLDVVAILPWSSTIYEADVYCGGKRLAADNLESSFP